jgi:hypothetical protein
MPDEKTRRLVAIAALILRVILKILEFLDGE